MELREFREALGLTLDEAAAGSGVSKGSLSKIERGEQEPMARTQRRIDAWAERERRRAGLRRRLTWPDVDGERAAPAAAAR